MAIAAVIQQAPIAQQIAAAVTKSSDGKMKFVSLLPSPKGTPSGAYLAKVLTPNGKMGMVWVIYSGDSKVPNLLTASSLYTVSGTNLSLLGAKELFGAPSENSSMKKNSAIKSADFIWGKGKPNIVFYTDPNCIFCHRQFDALKPLIESGKVTARVIPVAFLKPSSMGKAEAVLQGGVPALLQDEEHFDDAKEEGGIKPINNPVLARKIHDNTVGLSNVEGGNGIATPFMLIYANGKWISQEGFLTTDQILARLGN